MKSGFVYRILAVLVGVLIGVLLLEGLLRLGGWSALFIRDMRNWSGSGGGQYKIMCIGGSTTASGGNGAYPAQLERILNACKIGVDFKVINAGVDGQNSREVLIGLEANLDRWEPDMVIALVGNNDGEHVLPYGSELAGDFVPEKKKAYESLRVVKLWRLLSDRVKNRLSQLNWEIKSFRNGNESNVPEEFSGSAGFARPEVDDTVSAAVPETVDKLPETDMALVPEVAGRFNHHSSSLPAPIRAKVKRARVLNLQHRYKESSRILETEVLNKYPDDCEALEVYANSRLFQNDHEGALRARKRLLELEPDNPDSYYMYATSIRRYYHSSQARDMLEKALELQPHNIAYNTHLCTVLRTRGERDKLNKVIRGAISRNLRHHVLFGYAATCSLEQGNIKEAKQYYALANEMRLNTFSPQTRFNYPRIIDMVLGRGLKMVCVQDPVLNIEPLKRVLDWRTDVIYVDNEKVFKDKLFGGTEFSELFNDNFGGEFGHCSRAGNRVLAGNIARRIIEECFPGRKKQA